MDGSFCSSSSHSSSESHHPILPPTHCPTSGRDETALGQRVVTKEGKVEEEWEWFLNWNYIQMLKKERKYIKTWSKKKKNSWMDNICHFGEQRSFSEVEHYLHQSHYTFWRDRTCFCAFTNTRGAAREWRREGAGLRWETWPLLGGKRQWRNVTPPSRLVEGGRNKRNKTPSTAAPDTERDSFFCASEKCSFLRWCFCLYRECFAMARKNEQKSYNVRHLTQDWSRPMRDDFYFLVFFCLLYFVSASRKLSMLVCPEREIDVYLSFYWMNEPIKEIKTVVFGQEWWLSEASGIGITADCGWLLSYSV